MKPFVALDLYLNSLENQTTKTNYEIVLRDFLQSFSDIEDITKSKILEYKTEMADKAPQTIAARLSAIRSYCDFCWTEGWLTSDPSLSVKNNPFKKYEQAKNITFDDFKKILRGTDLNTLLGVRDRLFLSICFYSFGDAKQILNIRWDQKLPTAILKTAWYSSLRNRYEAYLSQKTPIDSLRKGYLFFNTDSLDNRIALSLSGARKIVRKYAVLAGYPENYLDFQAIKRLRAKQVYEQTLMNQGEDAAIEKIRKCCGFKNIKSVKEFLKRLL